jgi:hypothetical protein
LTSEQFQAARAEKWRQKANPLLTIEDAEAWIESTGMSLFLPRKTQLQAPAPSFVEAVLGESSATPAPAAIQNAFEMAARLFAAEKAAPLNLLGAVSEQPDFLVSPEALPYVFALRGDRDWKRGPRDKSSPLVVESWKLLKRQGALTASELQEGLGREVTEAAVLRALSELWAALRVLPVYAAGEATAWELFESRHQKAMQVGSGMAQATALSALISLYLDSAIAATSEEIEIFLSPLAPRSRIREVVHGLATTRQLLTIPLGPQSLLHIAGGLPGFPEVAAEIQPEAASQPTGERPSFRPRDKGMPEQRRFDRKPFTPREREGRPQRERPVFGERSAARGARKPSSGFSRSDAGRPRKEWKPRPEQGEFRPRREQGKGGFGKPFRGRTDERTSEQRPYKKFPPRDRDQDRPPRKEWKPRREDGERREFRPRRTDDSPGRREFRPREEKGPFGKKEWKPRGEGAEGKRGEFRPKRTEGGGFDRPNRSRTDDRRTGEQPPYKKFPPRDRDQERPPRKEWKPRREDGERREFRPRRTDESQGRREFKSRSFNPRREGSGFGDREKPAGEKSFGGKRPFRKSEGFNRRKPPQRERRIEGENAGRPGKSFSKPGFKGGKKFGPPKSGGRKLSFGAKRFGGKTSFGKRPNNRKEKNSSE